MNASMWLNGSEVSLFIRDCPFINGGRLLRDMQCNCFACDLRTVSHSMQVKLCSICGMMPIITENNFDSVFVFFVFFLNKKAQFVVKVSQY